MIVPLQRVLLAAQRRRYAVGAFNISDFEQAAAVVSAAKKLHSPVIINTTDKALAYAGADVLGAIVHVLAKRVPVPVVLNLDHGRELDHVRECLRYGWSGIMFDASTKSWEHNIRLTRTVKQLARPYGAGVEGEIGQVKYPDEFKKNPKLVLATPTQAVEFVRRTKVDALAVGIGNSHGLPIKGERLHFDLLAAIQRAVRVPLVLHGASGTSPASIRRAISLGICKINIDTDLRLAFTRAIRQELRDQAIYDPRQYLGPARLAMQDAVMKKIVLFRSQGKAR